MGLLPCHILPPLLPLLYFSGAATMPGSSSMNTHLRRVSSLAGQLRNLASIARSVLRGIVIVLLIFLVLLGGGVATLLAALHSPTFVPLLAGAATALLGGIVYLKWVEADELVGTLQLWSGGDLEQPPPGLAGSPEVEARESRARRSVRSSASELARVRSEGTLVPLIKEKEAALAAAEAAWRSARAERTRSIKTALMLAPDNMLLSVATTLMGVPAAVAGVGALLVWGVNAGWAHILGLLILAGGGVALLGGAVAWLCLRQLFYVRFEALIGRIVDGLLAAGESGLKAVGVGLDGEEGGRIRASESQPLLSTEVM